MKGTGLRGALNGLLTVKNAVSTGSKGVQHFGKLTLRKSCGHPKSVPERSVVYEQNQV